MKNFFRKLREDKNEKGSGIILVIVALSFLGILAGAMLTAVAYAYRLKLYDYNAKDNFHYVEQAMDEVYAGLGGRTTTTMQDAYTKTVEEMVIFDPTLKAYTNIGDEAANKKFKDYFMNGIKNDTAFTNIDTLAKLIQSYISNSSVQVVSDKMKVLYYNMDGDVVMTVTPSGATGGDLGVTLNSVELDKIVIQNLVLRRTANYQRSSANGTFTQTISTDVEISRPDFNVQFNTVSANNSVLYDYALIADSGVEINKSAAAPLLINGNIYAAADFYNKGYNQYGVTDTAQKQAYTNLDYLAAADAYSEVKSFSPVSSKTHVAGGDTFLFNARQADLLYGSIKDGMLTEAEYSANKVSINNSKDLLYNGENENSKYSGLYINGAKVSIMANTVVVPGSIAVMNGANLSVYNSDGTKIDKTHVWADNVILGGYSVTMPTGSDGKTTSLGSTATFVANMYVRDDLEVNSDYSKFSLIGNFYGYGNSTQTKRTAFAPTVSMYKDTNLNVYQQEGLNNQVVDRAHSNSSSIVVNGQYSELDLSSTNNLYVAGQAYIELSAKHEDVEVDAASGEIVYASGSPDKQAVTKEVITYDPTIQDYRTGESISVKSNQLLYVPNGTGTVKSDVGDNNYTIVINKMLLTPDSKGKNIFREFFSKYYDSAKDEMVVPIVGIVPAESTRTYFYFDFDKIWSDDSHGYESAEAMAAAFAEAYMAELNKSTSEASENYSPIKEYLDNDIINGEMFKPGPITLPSESTSLSYASGALTSIIQSDDKATTSYKITLSKDLGITRPTTVDGDTAVGGTTTADAAIALSSDFAKHYNYLKFSLIDLAAGSQEAVFVDKVVQKAEYGEASLSPLNRYLDMKKFYEVRPVVSNIETGDAEHVLKLSSGYIVWVSAGDVVIGDNYVDDDGVVRGIVISQGDVYFGTGVKRFEGLIISGDKIYIQNDITSISASPEVCKAIMTELQTEKDVDAEKVLRLFNGYSSAYDDKTLDELKALCAERHITYDADSATKDSLISLLISYDNNGDNTVKKINTIDYSDVVKYSNWMKNSE